MHTLSKLSISDLWGEKDLEILFHKDVNFLIGKNGSGKTTVINLIAAALTADYATLKRILFRKIVLDLSTPDGEKKGSERFTIEVEKKPVKNVPIDSISYTIRTGRDEKKYALDEIARSLGYVEFGYREQLRHASVAVPGLVEQLQELANVTWLSIHRGPARPAREDRSFESSVDKKLDELSNLLTRFFSALVTRNESETAKFQQTMFLSLIPNLSDWQLFDSVQRLDLQEERTALVEIFHNFKMKEAQFLDVLEHHFNLVKSAVAPDKAGYSNSELAAIAGMWSIHKVVSEWRVLLQKQSLISQPRDNFLSLLNEMFQGKRLTINERNELKAVTNTGRTLALPRLSSGEKQLLIILGEALLQGKAPWIYIADEPELSLHVTWQEKLTANLREINPSAQIIFATHSPDIVSSFEKKVFDMEKLIA
jgi:predicted ATP-binding protein involved in virulence